jgi:uncharacterized protein (TIGR00251 family)
MNPPNRRGRSISGGSTIARGKRGAGRNESPPQRAGNGVPSGARDAQITPQNTRQNNSTEEILEAREDAGGVVISVHAKPRASKTRVLGVTNGALEVALAAPPVDGAANEELVCALSDHFGIPRRRVTLVGGEASRHKRVRLEGLGKADLVAKAARRR